jgi:molybdopterin synthase catalytic subunit
VAALLAGARTGDGAVAVFIGVVRDETDGATVAEIEYTAYDAMAERELARIEAEIGGELPHPSVRLVHRLGRLRVGEASVAVVATAPHRAEAFAACREAIERIKARVPIWKKES